MSTSIKSDCDSESQQENIEISCVVCYDDLTDENVVSYKRYNDTEYIKSECCDNCVKHLIETSWDNYMDRIKKADCEAEMKRIIENGPPVNLRCMTILTVDMDGNKITGDEEFESLYFDNQVQSAKLKNSLDIDSDERKMLIHQQQQMLEYIKANKNNENNDNTNISLTN